MYTSKGWDSVFLPLSDSCTALGNEDQESPWNETMDVLTSELKVIHLPLMTEYRGLHPTIPVGHFRWLSVPPHFLRRLTELSHPDPVQWWIGQMASYVFRLSSDMQTFVEKHIESLGYRSPVAAAHIRRTDKFRESRYFPIADYMTHVEHFYERVYNLSSSNSSSDGTTASTAKRRVFLATDAPSIITEARQEWPGFEFIADDAISRSAGKTARDPVRHGVDSLRGVATDLYMLSRSDFLVCTFSSNLGRFAYEVMLALRPDAPDRVVSLDFYGIWSLHIKLFKSEKSLDARVRSLPGRE